MLKIIGALMIVAASSAVGFIKAERCRTRVRQLEAFSKLISHISSQIESFLTPLERIYADFQNDTLEKCGFLPLLRQYGGVRAVAECRARLCLDTPEAEELERFFSELGGHAIDIESRRLAYFEKRMSELSEAAAAELRGKQKLYRTLGFLVGTMLAVILI